MRAVGAPPGGARRRGGGGHICRERRESRGRARGHSRPVHARSRGAASGPAEPGGGAAAHRVRAPARAHRRRRAAGRHCAAHGGALVGRARRARRAGLRGARPAPTEKDPTHSGFAVETREWSAPLEASAFFEWLDRVPRSLYRIKGSVWLRDGTSEAPPRVCLLYTSPRPRD